MNLFQAHFTDEVWSIGHGLRPLSEVVAMLKEAGVTHVIDVRTTPYSSKNPDFNRRNLATMLPTYGMVYVYRGNNLGGLGENVYFKESLDELQKWSQEGVRIAVLCSETDHRACHRSQVLEREFEDREVRMVHL